MRFLVPMCMLIFFCMVLSCKKDAKTKDSMRIETYRSTVDNHFKKIEDLSSLFPKTVDEIKKNSETSMQMAQQDLDVLLAIKSEQRTFDNTARALDQSQAIFSRVASVMQLLSMTHPDKEIREAAHEATVKLSQFAVDLYMKPELYQAFKSYLNNKGKEEKLTEEEHYFLDETMRDFKRQGFDLPAKQFEEVKNLNKEIAQLSFDFEKNIAADKSSIKVSLQDLDGVDEHFIKALTKEGDQYILRCDNPTYEEVMNNCRVQKTRKDLYFAYMNRAYPVNINVLEQVIAKRDELAKKVGFESFAALNIDSGMAKNPARVDAFLADLLARSRHKVDAEFELLRQNLPDGVTLDEHGRMYPWNYGYVKSTYKKKVFNVDERVLAEYFPVEKALAGMFAIYQDFLGLEFKVITPSWKWHEEVQLIEITDKETKKLRGYLFLDLYPRDDKYTHACYVPIVVPQLRKNIKTSEQENIPSIGVVIANFPRANGDRPALFKHHDVETFFHEFGHAMHGYLGQTQLASFGGTSVKTDFVELPSQMFEEWMFDKKSLRQVGSHYVTGQAIPDDLIDKKIALKKFDSGYFVQRQAFFALISLNYYKEGAQKNTNALYQQIHEQNIPHVRFEPDTYMQASFGHLIGYGARYYSYLWSKVFALDLFYEVKNHELSRSIGNKLVKTLLSRGGSVDPNQLLKDFLGREPRSDAFMQDMGL